MCHNTFNKPKDKIREHDHSSGKYRGAACKSCNVKEGKARQSIPVFFHNGSNYDFHFIVKPLTKILNEVGNENKLDLLSRTTENYIAITYGTYYSKLVFLDSYRFLQKSLADVAKSMIPEDFKITNEYFEKDKCKLITRKGVYPYEYVDSLERWKETELPPYESFYSTLTQQNISTDDYEHAQNVWKVFECETLGDYHDLYLKADVLILADAFEKFREFFLHHHQIDPAYCFSAPGLTWECGFKYTKVELKLLADEEMLLMFENGIRGGFSGVLGD